MNARIRNFVHQSHLRYANRGILSRVAIYFHELEQSNLPAFCDALSSFQDRRYRFTDPQYEHIGRTVESWGTWTVTVPFAIASSTSVTLHGD